MNIHLNNKNLLTPYDPLRKAHHMRTEVSYYIYASECYLSVERRATLKWLNAIPQ